MHNATTKQRQAALRRRLGLFLVPRWVRERRARLAQLRDDVAAALGMGSSAAEPTPAFSGEAGVTLSAPSTGPAAGFFRPAAASGLQPPPAGSGTRTQVLAPSTGPAAGFSGSPTATGLQPAPAGSGPQQTQVLSGEDDGVYQAAATEVAPPSFAGGPATPAARGAGRRALAVAVLVAAVIAALLLWLSRSPASPLAGRPAQAAPEVAVAAEAAPAPAAALAPAVPAAPLAAKAAVAVVRGDTLWHLAATHLGDPLRWREIHAANRTLIQDPDLIYPGQQLVIPAS
jgi:nucleoid-associated protein YgaU